MLHKADQLQLRHRMKSDLSDALAVSDYQTPHDSRSKTNTEDTKKGKMEQLEAPPELKLPGNLRGD